VVAFENKVYVIGGIDADGFVLDLVQAYDPANDTWTAKAPMPTKREHIGATVLDSLIYVASGRVGNTSMVKLEAYSPKSDKWYTLKEMPTQRSDIGFAAAKGKLYAMGGEKPGIFDVNEEYDPGTNTWKTSLKMTATRKAVSVANFEDTLFVFGGFSANGLINTVEAFVPPGGATRIMPGGRTEGIRRHPHGIGGHDSRNALGRTDAPGKGRRGPGNPAYLRAGAGQGG
jgi:N-acetylneuraminic acid mutarotase